MSGDFVCVWAAFLHTSCQPLCLCHILCTSASQDCHDAMEEAARLRVGHNAVCIPMASVSLHIPQETEQDR